MTAACTIRTQRGKRLAYFFFPLVRWAQKRRWRLYSSFASMWRSARRLCEILPRSHGMQHHDRGRKNFAIWTPSLLACYLQWNRFILPLHLWFRCWSRSQDQVSTCRSSVRLLKTSSCSHSAHLVLHTVRILVLGISDFHLRSIRTSGLGSSLQTTQKRDFPSRGTRSSLPSHLDSL